jgi:PAS domain S-box-containing protein
VPSDVALNTALELFEDAPCGYLFTQPDGTISKVNQTFLRWTGYTGADLVGRKRLQDLLTVPASIFYETHFAPLLRMQGFVNEMTVDFVCAKGGSLPALVNSAMQVDGHGVPTVVRTTVFDIRERRRYERELLLERRRAEHLAAVVREASDAIVTTTPDLRVSSWNRGAELLFGYTAAEAIGRDSRELLVDGAQVKHLTAQLARLRAGEPVHYETVRRDKSGRLIEVSVAVTPHIEPPDEIVGFAAIIRDVAARKRLEEAQQDSRDLELANRLAHEINNPLQAILNCLTMLSIERESQYLPIAEQHLARVAQVVRDLVKITRH